MSLIQRITRLAKYGLTAAALLLPFATQAQQTLTINGVACTASPWAVSTSPSATAITIPAACLSKAPAGGTPITGSSLYWTVPNPAYNALSVITWNAGVNATKATVDCDSNYNRGNVGHSDALIGTGSPPSIIAPVTCTLVASNSTGAPAITLSATVAPIGGPVVQPVTGTATIASVSPSPAVQGASFTVTGTNFNTSNILLYVSGVAVYPTSSTSTTATGIMPAYLPSGSTTVVVSTNGQATPAFTFMLGTVTPPGGSTSCRPGVDCSVDGVTIPSPSRLVPGGSTPSHAGLNGQSSLYAPMNMWAAENVTTKCANASPPITRLWQHNINFATYQASGANDYPFLAPGEAMTYKFTAPKEGTFQQIQYNEGTQAHFATGYLTLSTKPCDFDVTQVGKACYNSSANNSSIYYRATSGVTATYECKLVPGQTYYLNLRNQSPRNDPGNDSCAVDGYDVCGGYVEIR